jgi:hypothetical protein
LSAGYKPLALAFRVSNVLYDFHKTLGVMRGRILRHRTVH